MVTETYISDDLGEVARSTCTYARLPGRSDNPSVGTAKGRTVDYAEDEEETQRPMLNDYLRITTHPDQALIELPHHSRIYNSFGSIQGGAVAVLVDAMATHLGFLTAGVPMRCVSAEVHYLAQAKSGPFRAAGKLLRVEQDSATTRDRISDARNNDRH